jgi:hypothetical protein
MQSKIEQIYSLRFKSVEKMEAATDDQKKYSDTFYILAGSIAGAYPAEELVRLMQIFQAIGKLSTVVLDSIEGVNPVSVEESERALYNALLQFVMLLCEDSERLGGIVQSYSQDILHLAELGKKIQKKEEWCPKNLSKEQK